MKIFQLIPYFFLVFISFTQNLLSVSLYSNGFNNPVSLGSATMGVGLKNSVSALYNNPGYLRKHNESILGMGVNGSIYGGFTSPVIPGGMGLYHSMENSDWGFFGNFSSAYNRYLPDRDYVHIHLAHLGFSYRMSENLILSMSLGPSVSSRFRSLSKWSGSGRLNAYYEVGNWSMGAQIDIPGEFYREDYRGSEELLEKAPERFSFGLGYEISSGMGIYGEIRRVFWENSHLEWNAVDETPDFERGIGPEISFSTSAYWEKIRDTSWAIRGGLEWGGVYSAEGKILRSLGVGVGMGYEWNFSHEKSPKSLSLEVGILDYSRTSTKKNRSPETIYSASVNYKY